MNNHYRNLLDRAVEESRALGLLHPGYQLCFDSSDIAEERILGCLGNFVANLYLAGLKDSESLNGRCIEVHDKLQKFLTHYGIESHMTIGSMHGQGWSYCDTDAAYLAQELSSPEISNEVRVHTWLTLKDATIVDWTGQAWYDVQAKENHPAERCLVYFPQGKQDETHHYMPRFVGREFLERTGCIARVRTS